jgi:hypothetical protein
MMSLSIHAAPRRTYGRLLALIVLVATVALSANAAAEQFAANALRGMHRVNVAVEGINADFARYGLDAAEMRSHVEAKLTAAGLEVADDVAAQSDAAVGQLRVKLTTVEGSYGYYSYAVALQARRKIPLSADGGFVSQNVWSNGLSGISNPSDLRKLYPVVDQLLASFLSAHGNDNGAAGAH